MKTRHLAATAVLLALAAALSPLAIPAFGQETAPANFHHSKGREFSKVAPICH